MDRPPIFHYTLVKLAARCNITCSYCYWFRDPEVYERPPLLTQDVEDAFLRRVAEHWATHRSDSFYVLFHGGEPLLFGKSRFLQFATRLREAADRHRVRLRLSTTTNGLLVDEDWARIFLQQRVSVTLSLDGPPAFNDRRRLTFAGASTYAGVEKALQTLRDGGIEPGVLAVCDPSTSPDELVDHFVTRLRLRWFDVLVPDATRDEKPASIARYYKRLFDIWFDDLARQRVHVRYVENVTRALVGIGSTSESLGYGPIRTLTLNTDGALEPLDVLRIAGTDRVRSEINVRTHSLQDAQSNPAWRRAYEASLQLAVECRECRYRSACGGGFLPSRWSAERGFDNPSAYCADLQEILDHAWSRIHPTLAVNSGLLHDATAVP